MEDLLRRVFLSRVDLLVEDEDAACERFLGELGAVEMDQAELQELIRFRIHADARLSLAALPVAQGHLLPALAHPFTAQSLLT